MGSESSSEDDERLREAIDGTFFNDNMYKSSESKTENIIIKQKSNRHLNTENQSRDFQVNSDMQTRIGKKISNIIENKVDFVSFEKCYNVNENEKTEDVIKLFSDSLYAIDPEYTEEFEHNQRKAEIKKRKFEDGIHISDKDAILAASVSSDYILQKKDTKYWKSRRKSKVYNYKKIKGSEKLNLIENSNVY